MQNQIINNFQNHSVVCTKKKYCEILFMILKNKFELPILLFGNQTKSNVKQTKDDRIKENCNSHD